MKYVVRSTLCKMKGFLAFYLLPTSYCLLFSQTLRPLKIQETFMILLNLASVGSLHFRFACVLSKAHFYNLSYLHCHCEFRPSGTKQSLSTFHSTNFCLLPSLLIYFYVLLNYCSFCSIVKRICSKKGN